MSHVDPMDGFAECKCPACTAFVAEYEKWMRLEAEIAEAGRVETGDECESTWQQVRSSCPTYAALTTQSA